MRLDAKQRPNGTGPVNEQTIRHLNQINRDFYRLTVEDFDESRGRPWPGWRRLLPCLTGVRSVLDVGCGNGRFGRFLSRTMTVHYHGIDNNPALLDAARAAFTTMGILPDAVLEERDLIETPLEESSPPGTGHDLVVLFGVLHHIPSQARRHALLRACAGRVAPGGLLVFTSWCFYEYARFRERLIPWPGEPGERGDYLMDWRRGHAANTALRYCHYIDETEHAELMAATGFTALETFRADGHTNDINRYGVLLRAP